MTATSTLDTARLVEGLREQTAGLARAVAAGNPEARVPTCPEWPLRTLVGHVGQEHRWAAELIRKGEQLPVPDPKEADPGAPEGWAEWLREGAEDTIRAIEETGAETTVQTLFGPRPASFWLRRMLSDTSVHHYDAVRAREAVDSAASAASAAEGFEPSADFAPPVDLEIADDLAADVIDENLSLLTTPAFVALEPAVTELRGQGERIALRPAALKGWRITRTPEGPRCERTHAKADATVWGPPVPLMLLLAGRIGPEDDRLTVTGDRALVDHWLTHASL
ncbi:maleylpyruvate isomerase family mycothiol-dependent enzyme [Streptomyces sp. NPDC041068]|uniref:maleylpyruvate isomerase family mycothiol-dependent enzyme n=1 Tax=Streptomyces sp. NPDC041068 TaxID=3155130 RepID=UPI0033EDE9F5